MISMDPKARYGGWTWDRTLVGKPLTDRKIKQYAKEGFYNPEFRKARKELMDKRTFRKQIRAAADTFESWERITTNIVKAPDGRLIYSPV